MTNDEQYKCFCCNPFHRGHRNIGCFQFVCGVFMFLFQIAATAGGGYAYKLSAGIWAGLFVSVAYIAKSKKIIACFILYQAISIFSRRGRQPYILTHIFIFGKKSPKFFYLDPPLQRHYDMTSCLSIQNTIQESIPVGRVLYACQPCPVVFQVYVHCIMYYGG